MSKDIYDLVKQAFSENEISKLLEGYGNYYIHEEYMAPANVPTNWMKLVESGINPFLKDNPESVTPFQESLVKQVTSPIGLYCVLGFLDAYLSLKKIDNNSINLDLQQLYTMIKNHVTTVKPEAKKLHFHWMGDTDEKIWERICKYLMIIEEDHGLKLYKVL